MFGELPKLFDRDFVIAFFLPSAIFLLASIGLLAGFDLFPAQVFLLKDDLLKGATAIGLAALLGGVFLLVMNYSIYRLLEGYGAYNPLRLLLPLTKRSYRRLQTKIDQNVEDIKACRMLEGEPGMPALREKRRLLTQYAAEHFPPKENRVLATGLGNAIRAFEDYPETMYGVDATIVWVRLIAVIPKDFRDLLNTEKAQTDLWLNLWLVSLLLIIEYCLMVILTGQLKLIWFLPSAAVLVYLASARAIAAAVSWGDFVKAAYDLYLPDLRTKLQLPAPADLDGERALWTKFSRQVLYHRVQDVTARVPPPNPPQTGTKE